MKKASITEAKNRLSTLIDGLKNGSPVLIVDRGRPVARLEPVILLGEGDQEGRLSRLMREGIVRPGLTPASSSLFAAQPPCRKRDASAVAALLAERRDGR
jgi:prevent-host-death family protein